MKTKNVKTDRVEFIISKLLNLEALDYSKGSIMNVLPSGKSKITRKKLMHIDSGDFVKRNFDTDHPWVLAFGTSDLDNEETLYSKGTDFLVSTPQKTIGESFEYVHIVNGEVTWNKIVKYNPKLSKGISTTPGGFMFEVHTRVMNFLGGESGYSKKLLSCNSSGDLPTYYQGSKFNNDVDGFMCMSASVKEELYKTGVFHVKITNNKTGKGIKMAVDCDAISDLMKFRDSPVTGRGNKKPIVHWVRKHARNTKSKKVSVSKHTRGIGAFVFDGFSFAVSEPDVKNFNF